MFPDRSGRQAVGKLRGTGGAPLHHNRDRGKQKAECADCGADTVVPSDTGGFVCTSCGAAQTQMQQEGSSDDEESLGNL